jgi:L-threonylcarbamoyladenylate synthase
MEIGMVSSRQARTINIAIETLKKGGVVAYPTDTAYGLAVDATNVKAVEKLYRLKGRDFKNPVHVILPEHLHTVPYASNTRARKLMKKFWPGPLTIVLPLKAKGTSWQKLSAGTKTIGIRRPNNKLALKLVEQLGRPITTTSANVSGMPNCYSVPEVRKQFENQKQKPDFYLDGGKSRQIKPSTVVSLIEDVKILRVGPISETQIKKALNRS